MTGVVGPNGCGKSNLLEALRWVMGEASYKAMRGSGMEDVIFSGSANRPARNMAEVVAVLDNSARDASSAFNSDDILEISRRIERDAGSAYRINGRDARARDVQLLFADASTGAHSPSLVRQGQISEIINAKPQARRKVLEEAAGISGLHQRRHEAELRLRAAENNLLRLDDVINELDAQHAVLKRQARQASRYRNLSAEIRKAQALILHAKWQEAKTAADECRIELRKLRDEVGRLTQMVAKTTTGHLKASETLPALREREAIEAAALNRFNAELARLDAEARQARERKGGLKTLLQQIGEDLAREKNARKDMDDALSRLMVEEEELKTGSGSRTERHESARLALEKAQGKLAGYEEIFEKLGAKQAESRAQRDALQRIINEITNNEKRLAEQIVQNRTQLEREEGGYDADVIAGFEKNAAELESALNDAEKHSLHLESEREAADMRLVETRRTLQSAERDVQALQTEAETLTRMLQDEDGGCWPKLIDRLKPAPGYEKALAALLGDDLEGALDEAAPVHWKNLPRLDALSDLPAGARPLLEYIEAPDMLTARLMQTGIVTHEEGTALQARLKPGQRLVSPDGDLWRWDGFCAAADAPTAAARRMQGRNRLAELKARLQQANEELAERRLAHENASAKARQMQALEKEKRSLRRSLQSQSARANEQLLRAEQQDQARLQRIKTREEALARLEEELQETRISLKGNNEAHNLLAPPDEGAEELQQARKARDEARATLAGAQADFAGLERDAKMRHQRLEAIKRERGEWEQRTRRSDEQIAALTRRFGATEHELARISAIPDDLSERREALAASISRTQKAHGEAADARSSGETQLGICERNMREAEKELAKAREDMGRAEIRVEAADERVLEAGARITEVLECAPQEAIGVAGFAEGDNLPEAAQAERKLERLKAERERLGGVNLRAGEEAEEIARRLEGMRHERIDLEKAIAKLRGGIGHLNREGRVRLLEAFEKVNTHFKDLFTQLFGGGKAELKLTESDDPLEAGLEIEARPPGKRPQSMSLLSGGEQALTALALIFAVFLTNPSPICVLDEIDAPLDDANVERVCDLLDKMAKLTDTRFLIITHHPYTMARMNRLFGVTMAEKGISQLVSVDLETAERIRETG